MTPSQRVGPLCFLSFLVALFVVINQPASFGADVDGRWYLEELQVLRVQQIADGNGITVAVVDTGVNSRHPALIGAVLPGADFTLYDEESTGDGRIDTNGHGTGMASLIVGHSTVTGIAPRAKILPVRVKAGDSPIAEGSSIAIASGIRWAVDHGADVINISLGSAVIDPRERSALEYARLRGVVVVAAVGNIGEAKGVMYPAKEKGVIAVAATGPNGEHASNSVTGPEVVISAPGTNILRASVDSGTVVASGTSDSAAIVSGIVALLLELDAGMTPSEVLAHLASTADDRGVPGRDEVFGYGIVNPYRALITPKTRDADSAEASAIGPPPRAFNGYGAWVTIGSLIALILLFSLAAMTMRLVKR